MLDGPGDFVTLELTATDDPDKVLRYIYQEQHATLHLNKPVTVPWSHLVHLLGDPFYSGKNREIAYENICHRVGIHPGQPLPFTIVAKDQDGDVISTVVDDPEGANAPTDKGDKLDPLAIRAAMIQMQRRMAELERQVQEAEAEQAADPEKTDLPKPSARAKAARRKSATTRAAESPVPVINPPDDSGHGSADPTGGIIPEDSPTQLPVGAS